MHRLWAIHKDLLSSEATEDWSTEATTIQEQIFNTQNWSNEATTIQEHKLTKIIYLHY